MDAYILTSLILSNIIAAAAAWFIASQRQSKVQATLSSLQIQFEQLKIASNSAEEAVISKNIEVQTLQSELGDYKSTLSAKEQAITDLNKRLQEEKETSERLTQMQEGLNASITELKTQNATILAAQEEREEAHQREIRRYQANQAEQKVLFENIANEVIDNKGKTFLDTSKSSLAEVLKPFREQINGFQQRVNEVHDHSVQTTTSLRTELQNMLEIGNLMSTEANNLTSALKGDSQQRGAWGESQLQRTLEMSGLVDGAHFDKQTGFKDQEGKQKYTDFIINLPDGKHIIIDSKVSLVAYDRAVSAATPEEEMLALDEHARAVRARIDDLVSKDYTNLIGVRSPSFVLMFIPIEPAYIDALKHEKDLFGYGYDKGIVLVSHTTLIPILRTVANLWMMERSNQEAREISESAGDIFNQVCTVAERLQKLGGTLGTVSKHYNNTVTALAGQQGLYGKVNRFENISSKVSKKLPAIEPAHIDFESEKLQLIPFDSADHLDEGDNTAIPSNGLPKQINGNNSC